MLESLFATVTDTASISLSDAILMLGVTFVSGCLLSATYMATIKRGIHSQSFLVTLILLPLIVAVIIFLIGSNVARAFSLAGAFSIIRFRSAPGDPKDITYVLFSMAIGLACGVGAYFYALFFTLVVCLILYVLFKINFGEQKSNERVLKILVPEDLNYESCFDDLMTKYTSSCELNKVRTTELGSLYELSYVITLRERVSQKEFLDLLRCRNGNLNITLSVLQQNESMTI